jgi:hypothetical protein
MEKRIVRYGDLVPCKTAFIDAHTPGSDQKENFTIIGGGCLNPLTNMCILLFRMGLTLGQQDSLRNVEIRCTIIVRQKFSSFYRAVGAFFGANGAMLAR